MRDPAGTSVTSPNARFVQWRAEFSGATASSPVVSGVTLAYLPQNNSPVLHTLNVTTQLAPASTSAKAPTTQAAAGTYSITVTDTGEAGASTVSGTASQVVNRGLNQQFRLSGPQTIPMETG